MFLSNAVVGSGMDNLHAFHSVSIITFLVLQSFLLIVAKAIFVAVFSPALLATVNWEIFIVDIFVECFCAQKFYHSRINIQQINIYGKKHP